MQSLASIPESAPDPHEQNTKETLLVSKKIKNTKMTEMKAQ